MVRYLVEQGAKVDATNDDGNTPLHVAAFLCRREIVQLLLASGASVAQRNNRRETPIDVVSGEWSEELAGFYSGIASAVGIDIDLEAIEQDRPKIAILLREHAKQNEAASADE